MELIEKAVGETSIATHPWNEVHLGEIASFRTGPFGSALHKSDYVVGGLPLVNPLHIVDGRIVPDERTSVDPDTAHRLSDFQLAEGDVVMGRRGEMGRCAVVRREESGWLCGTGSLIIRPKRDTVDSGFLQFILSSPQTIAAIESGSVGTTMVNLNQSVLQGLPIPLPSKAEQEAIYEAIADAEGLLADLDALIEKKRAIKTGTMQRLLTGRQRLPGFSGEWKETPLNDLGIWRGGGTPSKRVSSFWNGLIPWATPKDFLGPHMASTQDQITREAVKASATTVIPPNSVLVVTRSGVLRHSVPIATNPIPVAINQDVKALTAHDHVDPAYLAFAVRSMGPTILKRAVKEGTTVESVDFKLLKSLAVPEPDIEEQQAIAAVLSDMDSEITALEARRDKAAQVREGMMQELLTGRTRLV